MMYPVKICAVVLLLLMAGASTASAAEQKTFSFAVVPQFEVAQLRAVWMPILESLEKQTGYKFHMEGTPDIPNFEKQFMSGKYDFAYMNPYHAMLAMKTEYRPLVYDASVKLSGVMVVRSDSSYQSPQDLRGKTIAFPSPNALGAALMIRSAMKHEFSTEFTPLYAQTHASAYLNVVLGVADAAGGVRGTLNQQPDNIKNQLRVIYETRKVARHPLMVNKRVPDAVADAVQKAFLALAKTPQGLAMLAGVPMKDVSVADAAAYEELAEMGLEEFVEMP